MSLEFNKVSGAILGSLVFAMGVGFASELIFHVDEPETPGFEVAVSEEAPAAGGAEESTVAPIAVRLASADPAKGESLTRACAACHVFDSSNANKVGPGLWEIVNRTPGTHEGFNYSAAMVEFGQANVWDYDHLDHFLTNPKGLVAGTKMAYAGMRKPEDRADLIAYLRTLSASPAPLPAAEEAPAEAAPAGEEPTATEAPATEAPPAEAPAPEAPATETPPAEAPATEAPAAETPAPEAPAPEAPAPQ